MVGQDTLFVTVPFQMLLQEWPTSLRQRATFLIVLQQRAISYTRAYKKITPPLTYSGTYIYSATFIANVTHQHDNNKSLPGIYCYACYLVGLLAFLVLSNPLQAGLVLRCCHLKQFFHMGVSQYRSML